MKKYQLFIGGEYVAPETGKTFGSVNPYTGETWADIAGGVNDGLKHSGIGRESGLDAVKEFLQVKSVWIATKSSADNPFIIR